MGEGEAPQWLGDDQRDGQRVACACPAMTPLRYGACTTSPLVSPPSVHVRIFMCMCPQARACSHSACARRRLPKQAYMHACMRARWPVPQAGAPAGSLRERRAGHGARAGRSGMAGASVPCQVPPGAPASGSPGPGPGPGPGPRWPWPPLHTCCFLRAVKTAALKKRAARRCCWLIHPCAGRGEPAWLQEGVDAPSCMPQRTASVAKLL